MGASGFSPRGVPAGAHLPPAGWYPDPAGSELLRWWDGTAWTTRTVWPWARPAPPPTRLAAWLASPAGSLLFAGIAAVTAVGWAVVAAFLAVAVVTGQPVTPAASALEAFPLLPVADFAAAACVLASRAGHRGPAPSPGNARAIRKAARRGRKATRGRPAVALAVRGAVRRIRRPSLLTSLPRPVGWMLVAASSLTFLACAWLVGWSFADHGIAAPGRQLDAMLWMTHLIGWCGLACRRLSRNRAAATMLTSPLPRAHS